jgi:hypothetical protein
MGGGWRLVQTRHQQAAGARMGAPSGEGPLHSGRLRSLLEGRRMGSRPSAAVRGLPTRRQRESSRTEVNLGRKTGAHEGYSGPRRGVVSARGVPLREGVGKKGKGGRRGVLAHSADTATASRSKASRGHCAALLRHASGGGRGGAEGRCEQEEGRGRFSTRAGGTPLGAGGSGIGHGAATAPGAWRGVKRGGV